MQASTEQILSSYNDRAPLAEASTIPAPWYVDPRIAELYLGAAVPADNEGHPK